MRKITRSFVVAVALLLTTVLIANAGGWAVITLDDMPGQITAGQAFSIGFTVRQHGRTLRDDLAPVLRFDRSDAKDSFIATAKRSGESGHYVAEVTLPSEGQWNWKVDIEQFGMVTQDMSPLMVIAALAPAASTSPSMPVPSSLPVAAGALGAIVAAGAVALWVRTRARWTLAVVALAALVGVVGFATASTSVAQPEAATANVAKIEAVAAGRSLFIDKGCVMCHSHPEVKTAYGPFWIGDEPPNLGNGKYTAEYLKQWLKNPSALKPLTVMPNLHLSDAEITALIAFLGAK